MSKQFNIYVHNSQLKTALSATASQLLIYRTKGHVHYF